MIATEASASALTCLRVLLSVATCFFNALNCLTVGPLDCWLAGEAATYMAAATTATPTNIRKRFIRSLLVDPSHMEWAVIHDSTANSGACQEDHEVSC